jgi:hypothetical protein
MSWWNSISTLTALAAWDAIDTETSGYATDLSGNGHHANFSGAPRMAVVNGAQVSQYIKCPGGNTGFSHSVVNIPSTGVLFALVTDVRATIMLFSNYASNSVHGCLLDTSDASGAPYGVIRNAGSVGQAVLPTQVSSPTLFGVVFTPTQFQFFYKGAWLGNVQSANFSSILPSTMGSTWPSTWGPNCSVGGVGIFAGTATLAEINAMDSQLRDKLYLGTPSFRGLQPSEQRISLPVPEAVSSGLPRARFLTGFGRLDSSIPQAQGPGGTVGRYVGQQIAYRNTYQGGNGRIVGTVGIKGSPNTPVQRRVRLIDEKTGLLVREVFSDPVTGAYEFLYVAMDHKYTVMTYDYENNYRAVVADNITAEFVP